MALKFAINHPQRNEWANGFAERRAMSGLHQKRTQRKRLYLADESQRKRLRVAIEQIEMAQLATRLHYKDVMSLLRRIRKQLGRKPKC